MFKLHEVQLTNGERTYGYISRVDADTETAYLLGKDDLGVLGRHGNPVPFSTCTAIFAETTRTGVFDSEEQITVWRRAHRAR